MSQKLVVCNLVYRSWNFNKIVTNNSWLQFERTAGKNFFLNTSQINLINQTNRQTFQKLDFIGIRLIYWKPISLDKNKNNILLIWKTYKIKQ